ncbi:MAG: cation:proton antiporter [Ignavibacteriae bacterium]|nr:cation:proton antiporter [Ignavibacteriota bacterium]
MIYFFSFIILAIIFAAIRGAKGPTPADRIIALDNLTIIITAGLVLLSLVFERYIYLDVALIYGVLSFIGVLTLARYMEGGL